MSDVAIWNQCNNRCVMCTNPQEFQNKDNSTEYSFGEIKTRWGNERIDKQDAINLTGGEPTIHPDFLNILFWFREQYPENPITIATNGRIFCYEAFTKECLKIDNLKLEIALHGHDTKSHDAITRTNGSFKQAVQGIHNILKHKKDSQQLEMRIIITKLTYKQIDKILEFINKEFSGDKINDVVLIFMEMEGQSRDNFDMVAISHREVAKYLPQVMCKWSDSFRDLRLYHFPLCTLSFGLWKYVWRTLRGNEVIFLPRCKNCLYKKYCLGIHRDYLDQMGSKEFQPIREKLVVKHRSSFFNPISAVHKTARPNDNTKSSN